jgi:hypothetical protein
MPFSSAIRGLVGSFLDGAGVSGDLERLERSLGEVGWGVVVYVNWHACVTCVLRVSSRVRPVAGPCRNGTSSTPQRVYTVVLLDSIKALSNRPTGV